MSEQQNTPTPMDTPKRVMLTSANAIINAAHRLGLDPLELAERLEDGGIAELVESLEGLARHALEMESITSEIPQSKELGEAENAIRTVRNKKTPADDWHRRGFN